MQTKDLIVLGDARVLGDLFTRKGKVLTEEDLSGIQIGGDVSGLTDSLNSHTNNKSNPHGVTAAQAGALPLAGGMLNGPIKFKEASLPQKTLQYICGIDAFAQGGEMGWQSKSEFLSGYMTTASAGTDGILPTRLKSYQNETNTVSDPNSATETGFYYVSGTTNRPPFSQSTNTDYRVLTTAYSNKWLQQIATDFRCPDVFVRRCQNGSWQPWVKLLNDSQTVVLNPGSESNWREGILINDANNGWTTIRLGGNRTSGVDANCWSMHTYQQKFYLTHNGSSESPTGILSSDASGNWTIKNSIRVGTNQAPGDSILRNSKLVPVDTNPTVDGEICWTYA